MATFSEKIHIEAPKEKVWEVLADIGGIYKWNPGVAYSYATSEEIQGEGATRHCDLIGDRGYLEERVMDWREGEGYKIRVYETDLPIKRNVVRFSVDGDEDSTLVTVNPDYTVKYGAMGSIMDRLFLRRKVKKGMEGLLAGLKYHLETGEPVGDKLPDVETSPEPGSGVRWHRV